MLESSRYLKASDHRGMIYAFGAHPTAYTQGHKLVEADYNLSRSQTHARLVTNCIGRCRDLRILSLLCSGPRYLSGREDLK